MRKLGPLDSEELNNSLHTLVKTVQEQEFNEEIRDLIKNKSISQKRNILKLTPFLDANQILRVGGRIENANLSFDARHQILLPRNHRLTDRIIKDLHICHFHVGSATLLYIIRQKFWPIGGISSIKKALGKCVLCTKFNQKPVQPLMANLPSPRVQPGRPFLKCGIDCAGPFFTREGKYRNRKFIKTYLCVFICFSTRAVHLELVSDLSTEAFLACLRRFVSRRGVPKSIHTDNATNFVGARNELLKLITSNVKNSDSKIIQFATENQIEWKFIPVRSPHFGGLWEAAVKSAKKLSTKILAKSNLTFGELYTVFVQVEAILNSRPLTTISQDPYDLTPLTPGHFLIGTALLALPDTDHQEVPINRLRRFEYVQKLQQEFWQRWHFEYLNSLQPRGKWTASNKFPGRVGSMVLLREPTSPLNWKLGIITKLHIGDNNLVRIASIRTIQGEVTRAVNKLCVLPEEE